MANQQLDPPTLSEIARRLDDMREDLRSYASATVPLAVYQADNMARDREAKEMKADIAALQVKLDEERNQRLNAEADSRRDRESASSSKRLMWTGIIASPIAAALVAYLTSGGFHVGS